MKLIKSSFQILEQKPGIDGIYEQIELAGRTCYRSKRPEGKTAKDFVDRMIASGHLSVLEHGTVYLKIPVNIDVAGDFLDDIATWTKVHLVQEDSGNWWAVTTNYRRIVEMGWSEYLQYLCEPTKDHEKRVTVRFTSSIHFYKDITRHRKMSFSIESTRYCNYSKDRFDNELAFIIPSWLSLEEQQIDTNAIPRAVFVDKKFGEQTAESAFMIGLFQIESTYFTMLKRGWKPEEAAYFLCQGVKADTVMTGFISDYKHFFNLRAKGTTGRPHPTVKELAEPLMNEFINRGLI